MNELFINQHYMVLMSGKLIKNYKIKIEQNIQNKPDLTTLKIDWKYLKNKPELGTKDYKELSNTPKLIYSRIQKVETQSRLKYTFVDNEGKNLFINVEGDKDTIMGLPVKKIKEHLNNYK